MPRALGIEGAAAVLILIGATEAMYRTLLRLAPGGLGGVIHKKQIWVRTDIGQLAAIAAIRTFLNYFLERDIEAFGEMPAPAPAH